MPQSVTMDFATRAVVEFILRHRPQALPRLLAGLHEPLGVEPTMVRAVLCQGRGRVPASVLVEMLRRARQDILEDEYAPYRIGFEMVALHHWDLGRGLFLRLLGSPLLSARMAGWLGGRFTLALTQIKIENLTREGCRVVLGFKPGSPLTRDVCQLFRGGVAALPLSWGGEPHEVREEACHFQGDEHCVFTVNWRPFTWRDRMRAWLRLLPTQRQRFLAQTLEEHVRSIDDLTSRLQQAEVFCRAVVAAAADALVEVLPDGGLRALNQAALDLVGQTANQPGAKFSDFAHPDDLPGLIERHRLRLAGGTPPPLNRFRVRQGDDRYVRVEGSFSLVEDPLRGKIIIGILRDVSHEEALTQALEDERSRFRRLAEFSPFGLAILDQEGRYQYVNQSFVGMFGYTLEDFQTGEQWMRLAFPERELRQRVIAIWKADLEALGPGMMRLRTFPVVCKDGGRKEVLFRPVSLPSGEQVITYEDVTTRLADQRALSESEARLRTLVEGSPDAILLVDTRQRILKANQVAESLLGRNLAGRDLFQALPEAAAQPLRDLWEQAMALGKAGLEMEMPPDPEPAEAGPLVLEATAVSLGAGLVHLSLRDIGDRRRLETQRREAARLAGVLELAGTAAHELNQPLMALQGSLELMGLYQDPENLHRLAQQAAAEVTRLAHLVGSFSRIVRYETKEYLDGARIIDLSRAVQPIAELEPDPAPAPSAVPGDGPKTG